MKRADLLGREVDGQAGEAVMQSETNRMHVRGICTLEEKESDPSTIEGLVRRFDAIQLLAQRLRVREVQLAKVKPVDRTEQEHRTHPTRRQPRGEEDKVNTRIQKR